MSTSASARLRDWLSRRWSEQAKRIKRLDDKSILIVLRGLKRSRVVQNGVKERCMNHAKEGGPGRRSVGVMEVIRLGEAIIMQGSTSTFGR
jgi:hypothetical protein